MVVGESQKFPGALVVPSYQNLLDWAKVNEKGIINLSREDFLKSEQVKAKITKEINQINQNFGNWEMIKSFVITPKEFTIEGGELTPTLKLKRKIIYKNYEKELLEMYK